MAGLRRIDKLATVYVTGRVVGLNDDPASTFRRFPAFTYLLVNTSVGEFEVVETLLQAARPVTLLAVVGGLQSIRLSCSYYPRTTLPTQHY